MLRNGENANAPGKTQVQSMPLLALGLYGVILGEAFLVALLLWPNALQDDSFMTIGFLAFGFVFIASLLILASLISMKVHWLLVVGVFLFSLFVTIGQGWVFPSTSNLVYEFITFGSAVAVLSLILLVLTKGIWQVLWRTVLVAVVGAAIPITILAVRGPDAWKYLPFGLDILLVSLVVGALIPIAAIRFTKARREHRFQS